MVDIHPDRLHRYVRVTCAALGSAEAEAGLVADQLVGANLAGHDSHGVGMVPAYVAGALAGALVINGAPTVVRDAGPIIVLDGGYGFGQVMGFETMNRAIDRAREHGVALAGLRNSFHIGRIGHWGEQIAAAGLVSIHFVNVAGHAPLVAPFGGADARFSTNPVCIALPGGADGRPSALLDMATSIIAMGKARVAFNKGVTVPQGSVLNGAGELTDDPTQLFDQPRQGALVAFGDHKGSGLAMMAELLSAALLGGRLVTPHFARDGAIVNNMLTIVIDPDAAGSAESLVDEARAYLDYMHAATPRAGSDEVLVPGEPEARSRIARAEAVPVDPTTLGELRSSGRAAGVSPDLLDELLGA